MRTKPFPLVRPSGPPARVLVADGEHRAQLVAVFPFSNAYGERLGFAYEIQSGPDAGAVLVQSAARSASSTGKLADILRTLLGREPIGEELLGGVDLEQIGPVQVTARGESNRAGVRFSMVESVAPVHTGNH